MLNLRNKKVLITGHEGFLGSNMVRNLLEKGCEITGLDRVLNRPISVLKGYRKRISQVKADVSDLNRMLSIIKTRRPEIIIHLAAESIVGRAKKDPVRVFKSNIQGTWNVLEASRGLSGIRAVIVASSDKAYGHSKRLPYTEGMNLSGLHPYDASKSCQDIIARTYHVSYGLPVCVVRCGNIYGPGDFNFSRLIPDVIYSLIKSRPFTVRSDGTYKRDYVYVDDIVNGYMMICQNIASRGLYGQAFNLSCERPFTVIDVIKVIEKIMDKNINGLKILDQAKDEIHDQYLSSGKIHKAIGWKPTFSLDEGLRSTISWYEKVF